MWGLRTGFESEGDSDVCEVVVVEGGRGEVEGEERVGLTLMGWSGSRSVEAGVVLCSRLNDLL